MTGAADANNIHTGLEPEPNSLKFVPQTERTKDSGMKTVPMIVNLDTLAAMSAERLDSPKTELLANVVMPCSHSRANVSTRCSKCSKSARRRTATFSAGAQSSMRGQSSDFTSPFFSLVTYREAIVVAW